MTRWRGDRVGDKKDRPLRKSADSGILSTDKGKARYFSVEKLNTVSCAGYSSSSLSFSLIKLVSAIFLRSLTDGRNKILGRVMFFADTAASV